MLASSSNVFIPQYKVVEALVRRLKVRADWEFVCFVHVPGYRPTFVSKMDFIVHFIDFRTNSALDQNLVVRLDYQYPQNAWIESWKENGTIDTPTAEARGILGSSSLR